MIDRTGKSYEVWWNVAGEKETGNTMRKYVEEFLKLNNWTYEQLFEECLKASKSNDPRDMQIFNSKIVKFYHVIRKRKRSYGDKENSPGTAKNYVKAVVGFLQANGLFIKFTKSQNKEMSSKPTIIKDNFTKEEILTLLSATSSVKNKAIIMCLKDTGMAVSDLADLKVGDLKQALDNGDNFYQITYNRNKTEEAGVPCFGPDSLDALRSWMRWRRKEGFPCDADQPLFIVTQARNPDAYTKEEVENGLKLSGDAMTNIILQIVERSGIAEGKNLSAHCFRIFNQSSLEHVGMNKNIVYRIQARTIPDSGKSYSKGEVLSAYIKAYPDALSLHPKLKVVSIEDSRVTSLEQQVKQLTEKVENDRPFIEAISIEEESKPKIRAVLEELKSPKGEQVIEPLKNKIKELFIKEASEKGVSLETYLLDLLSDSLDNLTTTKKKET